MTIIVYRDGIMAADRNAQSNNTSVGTLDKIHVMRNGAVYGGSGSAGDCFAVASLLNRKSDFNGEIPHVYSVTGILVKSDGAIWRVENGKPLFPSTSPYAAVGVCFEFALGCLAAGATAEQTVELCSQHCAGIGGGVQVVDTRTTPRRNGVVTWLKEWLP